MSLHLRLAEAGDIPDLTDIWLDSTDPGNPPAPAPAPVWLAHELATGKGIIAVADDRAVGFGVTIQRGEVGNLAELFVRREVQSQGVGTRLLGRLLDGAPRTFFTVAAGDPRAVALYARHGLKPRWPFYHLCGQSGRLDLPSGIVTVAEASWSDPAFLTSDLKSCGRSRLVDVDYFVTVRGAIPLWFRRGSTTIGYGAVQIRTGEFADQPETAMIGPVGARGPLDAAACVLAAVRWAMTRARVLRIGLAAPHAALVPLLNAGFRIVDADTFMARGRARFCDPRTYVPSGAEFY